VDSITDIIQDLKADDPMTGVLEVIETLENAQKRIEELEAEIVTLRNFAHGIKQTVELMLMNPPQEGE